MKILCLNRQVHFHPSDKSGDYMRASPLSLTKLNNLLTAIGNDINHPPEKTRAMDYEVDAEAEWATQEINITVKT